MSLNSFSNVKSKCNIVNMISNNLVTFGNPYAEELLRENDKQEEDTTVSTKQPVKETPTHALIREFIHERLSPEEESRVLAMEAFTINTLLREKSPEERQQLLEQVADKTRGISRANPIKYLTEIGAFTTNDPGNPDSAKIYIRPDDYNSAFVVHETIHWLQIHGELPPNAALTMVATYLLMNSSEHIQGRIPSLIAEDVVYPYWQDPTHKDLYFQRVLEGKVCEAFKDGWILNPTDENHHKDMRLYLKYEALVDQQLQDEVRTKKIGTPEGDIKEPYEMIRNVGRARAERAYMVGYLSGNMDHAWTILWLHSKGKSFEDAEKKVVQAVLDGDTDKFYNQNVESVTA